jgi:hypothetical protein
MTGPGQMTKLYQVEYEEGQKQEHKHVKHHKDPSLLEMKIMGSLSLRKHNQG